MDRKRRQVLCAGSGAGLLAELGAFGLLHPGAASAQTPRSGFDAKTVADALAACALAPAVDSTRVQLDAPEIAENGAVVPVKISTDLPRVDRIAILVEKNPVILSALFDVPEGTEASIATRVKMAETCQIIVAVRSDAKAYLASKEVKVTVGGCGG
ncbi:MAG: thiosulfate oxidation carrier protein SoxY [Burkholderiaceae bacterium]|nr:thiosulfate oxidation carrier protein SoxY [Burkholderiaceae bacterium]